MLSNHRDAWSGLNEHNSIVEKLKYTHKVMQLHMPFVTRVAVALYDKDTDYLRTFAYSSNKTSPLTHYQAKLSECYSLQEIAKANKPRIIQDLSQFNDSEHKHASVIYEAGYRSSYTLPMVWEGELYGFTFFNSTEKAVFNEHSLFELDAIAHMISLMIYNEIANVRTLSATIKSALELTHSRDPETGCHLERMSRYALLIANKLADKYSFDDHFIEHIYLFAPVHDLGKLVIPDRVLLKEGPLSDEEWEVMRTHSEEGKKLVENLLENYELKGVKHAEILRDIVLYHHEAMDGSGYPEKLKGNKIPIVARIVSVADIFDALTSSRPYKKAWSNDKAFIELKELAKDKLDPDCVEAMIASRDLIEEIQSFFKEEKFD